MKSLLPVIHILNEEQVLRNADLVFSCDVPGIFLIDMSGADSSTIQLAKTVKLAYPSKKIGVNMLSYRDNLLSLKAAESANLDMVWIDNPGLSSDSENPNAKAIANIDTSVKIFGSVAFKTQRYEPSPEIAAKKAFDFGWVPTTSGVSTGVAADLDKIKRMSSVIPNSLAIASGITPNNISNYIAFADYFLVATGLQNESFYEFDDTKVKKIMSFINSRN